LEPSRVAKGEESVIDAMELHKRSIVFDGTCPLLNDTRYIDYWRQGGVTVAAPTVAADDDSKSALAKIGRWFRIIRERSDDLMHVKSTDDFLRAKSRKKLGILFHFQNTLPLERNLDLVGVYHALGVRVIQLTYNVKNFVGDGCDERTDSGLSDFGVSLIREMNRVGIAVDLSHTGVRTTLDAMQVSEAPVVFSHGNARSVCDNPRNLTDEQIKALAASRGVIGLNGFPAFVSKSARPTLDDMLKHLDYIADLVGIDHVGIGMDFFAGQAGIASQQGAEQMYRSALARGAWKKSAYPPPPYHYPEGMEDPRSFANLTETLLRRGYSVEQTRKVLGANFMRVYSEIWGCSTRPAGELS